MISILQNLNAYTGRVAFLVLFSFVSLIGIAQNVENRGCPTSYFRNNGNGQAVSVFAANILPGSIYQQTALTNGSQGNFTFKWDIPIINPPVVNKTWITPVGGTTAQNWVFGNNTSGSPFNPPGVPNIGDVKYTFYINNLPTSGTITIEFVDPFDGSYVNTCSYPLTGGSSSSGNLTSLAVSAPANFVYSPSSSIVLSGKAGSSAVPNVNAGGGTVTYSLLSSVSGVSIDASTGVISWNSTVAIGVYNLTVIASNGIQPDATTTYTLTVNDNGVSSGTDGGLESKSLGNAVAERTFNNAVQNVPAEVNYRSLKKINEQPALRTSTLGIRSFMPDQQVLGSGFTGYITSPTDILSFTNAADVVSVDYVEGGMNKAVAFCTKTFNGVYTHTKPVCDRLKGSELISVDTLHFGQFTFLLYQLNKQNKLKEFAVSFSAGFNKNDLQFTLQSEWTTNRYASQDTMYNFQLWSADVVLLERMLQNVLNKLNAEMPVTQTGDSKKPITYITKAKREEGNQHNLQLTIKNNTSYTKGMIVISGKANEQSVTTVSHSYAVTFLPNATSSLSVPLKDMAEAEITLQVNGNQEDFVYSNDGIWNLYKTSTTQVSEFSISNDTLQPKSGTYRLFRNVKLRATTSDYVTVYRMVKGGGVAADLSAYKTLNFTAAGGGTVRIRLMKQSVTNFNNQYEYRLTLNREEKEYAIPVTAFQSAATTTPVSMNDITIVSFTYEAAGGFTTIQSTLSNVRFAGAPENNNTASQQVTGFPNPVTSEVNLTFESPVNEIIHIQLISAATGSLVIQQTALAVKGRNSIKLSIPFAVPAGVYILTIQSNTVKYHTKITKQ